MVVFPKFHQVPFSKILTFYRRDNFKIEAEYDGDVPVMNPLIGQFEIGDVKPLADGGNQKVKVKVRINLHGVFVTSSANYSEKHEVNYYFILAQQKLSKYEGATKGIFHQIFVMDQNL